MATAVTTTSGVIYIVGWVNTLTGASLTLSSTQGLRVSNGAALEYGTMTWNANFLNIGTVTNGGSARITRVISAATQVILSPGGSDNWIFGNTFALTTKLNGVTVVGAGAALIVGAARVTAQNAANASIATFTVGATDADFEVSGNVNVTASTTLATTLTVTYTDEANVARTLILPVAPLSGTWAAAGAITGAGASVWHSAVLPIRAKATTVITILTSAGTFTGVTYTASGLIKQIT